MRALDRLLQRWRIGRAVRFVRDRDRLLDVGCFDRTLLDRVAPRVASATGLDPVAEPAEDGPVRILRGRLPDARFEDEAFDCVTMLAVLEHVEEPERLARELHRILAPGGRVVATVPHPFVDRILDVGMRLRLLDGMEVDAHHGFDVARTPAIFEAAGFRLHAAERFQLGLNRLFVFEKPGAPG